MTFGLVTCPDYGCGPASDLFRAFSDQFGSFDEDIRFIRPGGLRSAMRCIVQVAQRSRWAGYRHPSLNAFKRQTSRLAGPFFALASLVRPSHLNLKFASFFSGLRTNFRFKKVTSKSMFLVRFTNLKFASETAAAMMRTSNSPH